MISRVRDLGLLQTYVQNLRYAVATTNCRVTVDALQRILKDAETSLDESRKQRLN